MDEHRSRTPSIDSRNYAIPEADYLPADIDIERNGVSESDDSFDDDAQSSLFPTESSGTLWMNQIQDTPMFDSSKFLFESVNNAINDIDFSESLAIQAKTSALINSKSRELKGLIKQLQEKLDYYNERFKRGAVVSSQLKVNLQMLSKRIATLDDLFSKQFPIEYNQSKEKVMERTLND
ncbi:Kxd1 [Kluyveromyces lactis]|nr:Kxd1 [Kluyveromyces lactis]